MLRDTKERVRAHLCYSTLSQTKQNKTFLPLMRLNSISGHSKRKSNQQWTVQICWYTKILECWNLKTGKEWIICEKYKITWTVFLILCEGPGYSGEYRSVRKSELISVDFPSPDSPERRRQNQSEWLGERDAFHAFLFSDPLFHATLEQNVTQSPDVYQLHF